MSLGDRPMYEKTDETKDQDTIANRFRSSASDFTSTSSTQVRIKVRVNTAHYGQLIALATIYLRWMHLFDGVNE